MITLWAGGNQKLTINRLSLESAQRNVIGAHIKKDILMAWTVVFLNEAVMAELSEQPADIRARFERIVNLIKEVGLEQVREPHVKHLDGPLWEMRMTGRDTIARAIYVKAEGQRLVVARVFTKKQQKTPKRELDLALKRAEDIL